MQPTMLLECRRFLRHVAGSLTAAFLAVLSPASLILGSPGATGFAQSATAAESPALTPLLLDVLAAPHAVQGSDGQVHLVYELQLRNPTPLTIKLSRVTVLDPASGNQVLELDRSAIASRFALGGNRGVMTDSVGPAQFGVLFLHVTVKASDHLPTRLVHRVEGAFEGAAGSIAVEAAQTDVVTSSPAVLGAPLR